MFGLSLDQLEAIKLMLAYFAAITTVVALITTAIIYYDVRQGKIMATRLRHASNPRPKQELDADLDHIEQALRIANS